MRRPCQYGLAAMIFLLGHSLFAYEPEDCVRCHQPGSLESRLQIPLKAYEDSVHAGEITCQDCHRGVEDTAHKTDRGSGRVDCGPCHEQENQHGLGSERGIRPQCQACHGSHGIFRKDNKASRIHPQNLKETCGQCHPNQTGKSELLPWLTSVRIRSHGKQDFGYAYDSGDCLGCHQGRAVHGEPALVNDRNCHRCHMPIHGQSPLLGSIHPVQEGKTTPSFGFARAIYSIAVILAVLGAFGFFIRGFSCRSRRPRK
jgi:hypothetical protein